MCLYPKLIRNKKYYPTKKNGFNPPPIKDLRVGLVPVACGKCIECMKQKAREWQVRICEEEKKWKNKYCYTLTFSCEELERLCKETHLKESNAVATKAVRRFLERWRKIHKKSLQHWFVTELGHDNTERIHLHGIIFSNEDIKEETLYSFWKYGHVRLGHWYGLRTINYLIKYVHKVDNDHKNFVPVVLCSKGIGDNYTQRYLIQQIHKFDGPNTIEYYRLPNGAKVNLPIYYRNKLWTEDQREQLWVYRIEKAVRYVMGNRIDNIDTIEGEQLYNKILKVAQETNKLLGFGDDSKEWQKKDYNVTLRMLNKLKKKAFRRKNSHASFSIIRGTSAQ